MGYERPDHRFNDGDLDPGLDLGTNDIAACSDNMFFNPKHLNNIEGKDEQLEAEPRSEHASPPNVRYLSWADEKDGSFGTWNIIWPRR